MKISDIYPAFIIDDEWGRKLEVRARQSLFTRKPLNAVSTKALIGEEEAINRVQFALMLLQKVEELAGLENNYNQDDPSKNPPSDTPTLDNHFGPKKRR